ncbi:ead/Ea22-like family protein [Pseudomonas mosselii]|uniref:ead/Ea22-like family protein n=1 Tax=Pseudomonas mosselii TaxID=78327 RepID=UPI0020230DAC|nr:ead/Ea22-like family protein [Pseudomonas mosselii]MCL8299428.1 hypothetical protein [Pseudomonas mosselii]MCL8339715.1 hypothetical protein [Pseudomonas mosselii]
MTTNNEKLKALALLATKSQWTTDGLSEVMSSESDQLNSGYIVADCQGPDRLRNAAFIAAANPATILALIEENEALRKDAERYRWLRDPDGQEDLGSEYNMPPIICGYAEHEDVLAMDALDRAIDTGIEELKP